MSASRVYSERLGAIRDEQFQAALDRFGLGRLLGTEPVSTGLFGQNVYLTTSSGSYVFRGCPHYDWQFPKERLVAELIYARTDLPSPWPYWLDPSPDLFGWSYVLMPRLPGHLLRQAEAKSGMPWGERAALANTLGNALARLHIPHWEFCGNYDLAKDTFVPITGSWPDHVVARIRGDLARSREHSSATTDADEVWVEGQLAEAFDALGEPFQPSLVHEDWKIENLALQRDGQGCGA